MNRWLVIVCFGGGVAGCVNVPNLDSNAPCNLANLCPDGYVCDVNFVCRPAGPAVTLDAGPIDETPAADGVSHPGNDLGGQPRDGGMDQEPGRDADPDDMTDTASPGEPDSAEPSDDAAPDDGPADAVPVDMMMTQPVDTNMATPPDTNVIVPVDEGPDLRPAQRWGEGLVAHWRFDETMGSTMAKDSSGNENTGTLKNLDPAQDWLPAGKVGGALYFDGRGFVSTKYAPIYDTFGRGFSVALWLYRTSNSGFQAVVHRQEGYGSDDAMLMFFDGDTLTWGFNRLAGPSFSGGFTTGRWYHVAATYDGAKMCLYVDGELVSSVDAIESMSVQPRGFTIGAERNSFDQDKGDGLFRGKIDDVLLYKRALTVREIQDLVDGNGP